MDSAEKLKDKLTRVIPVKKVAQKFQELSFAKKAAIVVSGGLMVLVGIGVYSATHSSSSKGHGDAVASKTDAEKHEAESEAKKKHEKREIAAYVDHSNIFEKIIMAYRQAFVSVQAKVEELHHIRELNVVLRKQNSELRIELEKLRFENQEEGSKDETEEKSLVLNKETGSKVGRIVASIEYQWPDNFSKEQLYTLGLGFLKSGEYEKSAKIFTYLSQNGGEEFTVPEMDLVTGIALYHIDAFDIADKYFENILKTKLNPSQKGLYSKARLFRALVSKRKDQGLKAQYWLRDLMEHDPHSKEAAYINSAHGGNHGAH